MPKLQWIDELLRREHAYLCEEDECAFLREYTAGAGYGHGETNSLISNLKKKLDRRDKPEWCYKERAIETAGRELRAVFEQDLREAHDFLTRVPMPPSLAKTNAMHDDRVLQIINIMTRGLRSDVRELVIQTRDMPAAHEVQSGPDRTTGSTTSTPLTSPSPIRHRRTSWSSTMS